MITHLGSVCIFISDHYRANALYLDKHGMEFWQKDKMTDDSGDVWISVKPPSENTEIVLNKHGYEAWRHYRSNFGAVQSIMKSTDDILGTVAELRARGVIVIQEPDEHQWGGFAIIDDSEGNSLILVQPNE